MSEGDILQTSKMEEDSHKGNGTGSTGQDDQVDAKGFAEYVLSTMTKKKKKEKTPEDSSTPSVDKQTVSSPDLVGVEPLVWTTGSKPDDEEYNMGHKRRGVALLFNHSVFHKLTPRDGTKKDGGDLEKHLTQLGFEVRVRNDLKQSRVKEVLEETSKEDHGDADCILVFVMSHGESGYIFARDSPYREELLWKYFTGDNCSSLRGKPKLFFIQACRGDRVDSGVRVVTDSTDSAPMISYTIPTEADILVAYSTVNEYYAWRSPSNGSWYVQALCEELRTNGETRDLLTILTFVNRRVAIDYKSNVPSIEKMHMKVQMPTFSSRLTRLLYFRQKSKTTEAAGKRKTMSQ